MSYAREVLAAAARKLQCRLTAVANRRRAEARSAAGEASGLSEKLGVDFVMRQRVVDLICRVMNASAAILGKSQSTKIGA